tara:strand:- start:3094 stop:3369 length:276 start_codon:yes stop_codon:yes gene_type:complete
MKVSIFQNGNLLHANRGMFDFVGFGLPTGNVGGVPCFESITVEDARFRRTITGSTYGGPVSVCVRKNGVKRWYGIADAQTVAERELARVAK